MVFRVVARVLLLYAVTRMFHTEYLAVARILLWCSGWLLECCYCMLLRGCCYGIFGGC